jgi:hypothetical protein
MREVKGTAGPAFSVDPPGLSVRCEARAVIERGFSFQRKSVRPAERKEGDASGVRGSASFRHQLGSDHDFTDAEYGVGPCPDMMAIQRGAEKASPGVQLTQ